MKTYVVGGMPFCGTTAMTRAHIEGGIPGLWRRFAEYNAPYPAQTLEFPNDGAPFSVDLLRGHVVKLLELRPVEELPAQLDNVYVAYMARDDVARHKAHPSGHTMPIDSINHLRYIKAISQDPRVEKFVIVDFDEMVDNPLSTMKMLVANGWEFNPEAAAGVIDSTLRHA